MLPITFVRTRLKNNFPFVRCPRWQFGFGWNTCHLFVVSLFSFNVECLQSRCEGAPDIWLSVLFFTCQYAFIMQTRDASQVCLCMWVFFLFQSLWPLRLFVSCVCECLCNSVYIYLFVYIPCFVFYTFIEFVGSHSSLTELIVLLSILFFNLCIIFFYCIFLILSNFAFPCYRVLTFSFRVFPFLYCLYFLKLQPFHVYDFLFFNTSTSCTLAKSHLPLNLFYVTF